MSLQKASLPSMAGALNQIYNPTGDVFNSGTAFTPASPLAPAEPQNTFPRAYETAIASNINFMPRQDSKVNLTPFALLEMLANTDLVKLAIDMVINQARSKEWDIVPYDKDDESDYSKDIARVKAIFEKPDTYNDYYDYMYEFYWNIIVYDALTLYKIPTRDKKNYCGLLVVNGSTIKPLVTTTGLTPQFPNPAFQQVIYGRAEREFTTKSMIYSPMFKRPNTPYGCSMVERIMITINSMTNKQLWDLNYFTNGSTPDGGIFAPRNPDGSVVTTSQLKEFQAFFDNYMAGNTNARQGVKMFPEGTYTSTKVYSPNIQYYEWLVKIICANFGIPQQTFIHQMNRATSQTSDDHQGEFGLDPLIKFKERKFTKFIREDLGCPHLKFAVIEDKTADEAAKVSANVQYFNIGARCVNDILKAEGRDSIPGGDKHYYNIGNQLVPVDGAEEFMNNQKQLPPATTKDSDSPQNNKGDKEKPIKPIIEKPVQNKPQTDKGLTKAELELLDFRKYTLNNLGKKKRKFEPKYLAKAFIDDIYKRLEKADNIQEIKELFKADDSKKKIEQLKLAIITEFEKALKETGEKYISTFDKENIQKSLNELENYTFLQNTEIVKQLKHILTDINKLGFEKGISTLKDKMPAGDIKFSYEYATEYAAEWATNRAQELITGLDQSTRAMVYDTIQASLSNDEGWQELKQKLVDNYAFSGARAETIARTESGRAYNIGYIQCCKEVGINQYYVTDGDGDDECAAVNGSTWTAEECEADPLGHPNCSREFEAIIPEKEDKDNN